MTAMTEAMFDRPVPNITIVATLSLPRYLACSGALNAALEAAYGAGLSVRQVGDVLEVIRR